MRFSVIIPLYNKAPYIKKALNSVLCQTFKDYELIIVDDGSTDESYLIAKESLEGTKVNYSLIQQENAGVSTARNNGVAASKGNYVCFLDADDWWAPTFLEKMNSFIDDYPDAGIYGTNYYYVKNGRQRICVTTAETGYINYCRVYAEKLQMPLWTGAVCIPRRVFEEFGGFRPHLKLGEDFDLWIRISLKYKVAFLNAPLAYYFQDSEKKWRAVTHLHAPDGHMLWNLEYLQREEKTNLDYKILIDKLRVNNLFPYYLSRRFRTDTRHELAKVDWSNQSRDIYYKYRTPVFILIIQDRILRLSSLFKQLLIHFIKD